MSVRVTTFNTLDEAFTKLSTGRLEFDVIFTAPDQLLAARRAAADPAAELRPDPEPREERLAGAAQPVLRRRPALLGPVHASTRPGSAGATTSSATSTRPSSTTRGTRSGRREPFRGRVGVLDDSREALGMALMRRGVTRPQHRGPGAARSARRRPQELNDARPREGHDHRLRDAARRAHVDEPGRGRATCSTRSSPTCPRARRRRALVLVPEGRRADLQRLHRASAPRPTKPVMAHRFLNYMLDHEGRATRTSSATSATSRRSRRSTRRALFDAAAAAARTCANCVVTREDYANGNAYLALTADGRRLWDRAWAAFRNG